MRRRSVVVLFQHQLFGEAIARALAENDQLKVTAIALRTLLPRSFDGTHPDALVVEGPLTADVAAALLGAPPALTVVVGPETNTAEVFERREVIDATAAAIGSRIIAASGANRVTVGRRRATTREDEQ